MTPAEEFQRAIGYSPTRAVAGRPATVADRVAEMLGFAPTPPKPDLALPGSQPSMSVFEQALQQYPILRDLNLAYLESPGASDVFLEFWPPDEPGAPNYPRPDALPLGRPGVEVYSDKVRPIDVLGDVVSHYLIDADPKVARFYEQFRSSLTDEQKDRLRRQYEYSRQHHGEARPYDVWEDRSGLPSYFRGYPFQQWPDSEGMYTPDQLALFNEMMGYLTQPVRQPLGK